MINRINMEVIQIKSALRYQAEHINQTIRVAQDHIETAVSQFQANIIPLMNLNTRVLSQQIDGINAKIDAVDPQFKIEKLEMQLHSMEHRMQSMEQTLLIQEENHQKELMELKNLFQEQTKQLLEAIKEIPSDIFLSALEKQIGTNSRIQNEELATTSQPLFSQTKPSNKFF